MLSKPSTRLQIGLEAAARSRGRPERLRHRPSALALQCRRKFLGFFPGGFQDETYVAWERGYKWTAHTAWQQDLGPARFQELLQEGHYAEAAARALRIESRTNLLFSFEKMALRDAVRTPDGARRFAEGLAAYLHGPGSPRDRFDPWRDAVAALPRRQTRVLTWPLLTVFGFLAQPRRHMVLKPNVTQAAARAYGFDFRYASRPTWETYASLLDFAGTVRRDLADLAPRDLIDVQSFIWVQGSDEY
ncbi:MAG TPA: hypothetical protein VM327_00350 [Candidatus Thermoplasmatota archaeon]|nr:hypothetical protein [Candidatus Thermoplasmatota archaeon]